MKQNINPVAALVAILFTVGIAGFFLWYSNRERPAPTHYGLPRGLQRMEDARAGSFVHKSSAPDANKSKKPVKSGAPDSKANKDSKPSKEPAADKE